MKSLIVFALIALSVSYSQAQEGSSSLLFGKEEAEVAPRGLLPFIAADGGYTGYDTFAEAEGTPASLKLLGSWYLESPWVMDFGYGFNNQQFSNSNAAEAARTEGAMELAARYRTENRWQLGAIYDQYFNQGDAYAAYTADAQFAGLQVLKEFNMSPSWLGRLGGRVQSLTNNTDGLVIQYLIDLQIGWNPGAYKPSTRSAAAAAPQETIVQEAMVEETVKAPAAVSEVSFSQVAPAGAATAITFGSSRSAITSREQQRLDKIAKVLRENPDLVDKVEVRGFADSTGSEATNDRISQARADSVRKGLQKAGLDNVALESVGKGSTDSFGSKAQDRRAELIFHGVKDEDALRRAFSEVK